MPIDLTSQQTLDDILAALQEYKHPIHHKLDTLVVAYMAMDMQSSGKTHFSVDDAKRYLFRIYTAPDSEERLAGDTRIGGDNEQDVSAYLSVIKGFVRAAKTDNSSLTDTDIEDLIVTKMVHDLHEKWGHNVESLAMHIKGDADLIFAYLLSRSQKSQKSLPYLDRSRKEILQRSDLPKATAYALIL